MMRALLSSLRRDTGAAAAAEMALMVPLLTIIMFGGMEGGAYMWTEHKVVKAVRDGARYAGRQTFESYDCAAESVDGTIEDNIQAMTRLGVPDPQSQIDPRIPGWGATDADGAETVTVTVECDSTVNDGLYAQADGTLQVRVAATVDYPSLFGSLGFDADGAVVRAEAESPVMGL